jgi:hypothetical protein
LLRGGCWAEEKEASGSKARVFFFKKKKQKTFSHLGPVGIRSASPGAERGEEKVFLLLFVHKKKTLAFLPLASPSPAE